MMISNKKEGAKETPFDRPKEQIDYGCSCMLMEGDENHNTFRMLVGHHPYCSKLEGIVETKNLPERVKNLFVNADKQIEGLKGAVDELNEQIEYCRTLNQQLLSEKTELANRINSCCIEINKLTDKINELEREKFYRSETERQEMLMQLCTNLFTSFYNSMRQDKVCDVSFVDFLTIRRILEFNFSVVIKSQKQIEAELKQQKEQYFLDRKMFIK